MTEKSQHSNIMLAFFTLARLLILLSWDCLKMMLYRDVCALN